MYKLKDINAKTYLEFNGEIISKEQAEQILNSAQHFLFNLCDIPTIKEYNYENCRN